MPTKLPFTVSLKGIQMKGAREGRKGLSDIMEVDMQRKEGGCRAGWVWRGLGGLASDAFIIDQLEKSEKNMRTEYAGGGESL